MGTRGIARRDVCAGCSGLLHGGAGPAGCARQPRQRPRSPVRACPARRALLRLGRDFRLHHPAIAVPVSWGRIVGAGWPASRACSYRSPGASGHPRAASLARARVCVLTQRGRRIRVCPAATGLGPLRRRRDPGLVSRHRPRCARWRERRSLGAVPHRLVTDDRLALDSLGPPCLTSPTAWVGRSRAAACRATDDEPSDLSPWELAEMSRVPPSVLLPPTECMGAAGMRTFVPVGALLMMMAAAAAAHATRPCAYPSIHGSAGDARWVPHRQAACPAHRQPLDRVAMGCRVCRPGRRDRSAGLLHRGGVSYLPHPSARPACQRLLPPVAGERAVFAASVGGRVNQANPEYAGGDWASWSGR